MLVLYFDLYVFHPCFLRTLQSHTSDTEELALLLRWSEKASKFNGLLQRLQYFINTHTHTLVICVILNISYYSIYTQIDYTLFYPF